MGGFFFFCIISLNVTNENIQHQPKKAITVTKCLIFYITYFKIVSITLYYLILSHFWLLVVFFINISMSLYKLENNNFKDFKIIFTVENRQLTGS